MTKPRTARSACAPSTLLLKNSFALPRPLAALATWTDVARPVLAGAGAALTEGPEVEVLDAIATGLPALRRECGTADLIRFLMELANCIEAGTGQRPDALHAAAPPPRRCLGRALRSDRLPFDSLKGGESVVVGTGETVPVHGLALSGAGYADQPAVTGESLPLSRMPGEAALSGSSSPMAGW